MSEPVFDLLIRGGTLIDGTRAPRFDADVGIINGRIAAIGDLANRPALAAIDASGRVVAPGFIDAHAHDDQALLAQPDMTFKVSQGVTTVIAGNCGISAAPLAPETALPPPLDLLGVGAEPRFDTFRAYFAQLDRTPAAVNVASLVGHSTLRARTMASLDRPANEAEIAAMQALLAEALDAGAIGLSTGTFYPPAARATTEEIIAVGRPVGELGALYVTHMRDEADRVMEALEETFTIGRALDVPVVVSHHKVQKKRNFGRSAETLAHIRERMRSQRIGLDCYPYTAGSTMIRTEPDVRRILAFDDTMIGSDGIPVGDRPHPRLWGTFPRVLGRYARDVGLFRLETAVWKMTGLTARTFGLAGRGTLAVGHAADVVVFDAATVRDVASYEDPKRPAEGIHAVIVNGAVTWADGRHTGARRGVVLRRDAPAKRRAAPAGG